MPVLFEEPAQNTQPKKHPKKFVGQSQVRPHSTPLTSYVMHPSDIRFETQEAGEEVILFMRQHIITLVPNIILGIILLFVPIIVFPFLALFLQTVIEVPSAYPFIGTLFWYVAVFGYLLTSFIHWFFNIFIVTDHRIIDIDFLFLLYKKFAETRIDKIQDISFRTGGIMATFFNFGDVMIQTAGELPNFVFEKVPYPAEVVQIISELSEKKRGRRSV